MRRFVVLVHKVPVTGTFTLNDLAGGAGRMDEIARAVSTGFTLSNDLRKDTEMVLLFPPSGAVSARRIRLDGTRIRYLNPDERSTAALLKNALVRSIPIDHDVESSPGIVVGPVDNRQSPRIVHHLAADFNAVADINGTARRDADVIDDLQFSGTALHLSLIHI